MVKMHKLTKGGQTIYPATIYDAVVKMPEKSTLTPPPVVPVGLHFPFILQSYIGPGMVSPTTAEEIDDVTSIL